jgi:type VI protein secretion system component VasF
MDDLPLWMKLPIWLVVGGTVAYAIVAMIYSVVSS